MNEIMVRVELRCGMTLRIWVEIDEPPDGQEILAKRDELAISAQKLEGEISPIVHPGNYLTEFCRQNKVNAVEVLYSTGNGALHYPSWP